MSIKIVAPIVAGVVAFLLAFVRVESYDETYWSVIAQRFLSHGDLPYFDLLDNKGPLLYAVVALAVLLPGSLGFGLALVFGTTAGAFYHQATRLGTAVGQPPKATNWLAAAATASAVVLNAGSLTTELLASCLVMPALRSSRTGHAMVLLVLAALIDPRAALFIVPVVVRLSMGGHLDIRPLAATLLTGLGAVAVVFATPPLRLSLFELGLASRIEPEWARLLAILGTALLPMAVLATLRVIERPAPWALVMAVTVLGVGGLGGLPVGHHWAYMSLLVVTVPISASFTTLIGLIVVMTTLFSVPFALSEARFEQRLYERIAPDAARIPALLIERDRVFAWSEWPYLMLPFAGQTLGNPSANPFGWDIGTDRRVLERLQDDLAAASVIVVEAPLDPTQLRPNARTAASLVSGEVAQFECSVAISPSVTFHRRDC